MDKTTTRTALIETNLCWLRQALSLLDRIDDRRFTTVPRGFATHRVSGHLRHILEFYECFLDGLESCHIDYDARKRDLMIESSVEAAAERIREIVWRLTNEPALRHDGVLFVRMEDASAYQMEDPYLMSSVGRELQTLSSHTIHHFALIAMTLKAQGFAVDSDFGVAPSTLRHRQRVRTAEAA